MADLADADIASSSDRDQLLADLDAAHQTIASLTVERDGAIRQLAELRRSMSWRVTRPFRALSRLLRGDVAGVAHALRASQDRVGPTSRRRLRSVLEPVAGALGVRLHSTANFPAIAAIVAARCEVARVTPRVDPLCPPRPATFPAVDISAVTYNSSRWIEPFVASLLALDYPLELLSITFVDHGSKDDTVARLEAALERLGAAGLAAELRQRPNRGYGAGHNAAHTGHHAPFVLVTNVDLEFDPAALATVAASAMVDQEAAAWELRQKPYEHPKFYDPVTGLTNWNSHACVLLRRSALERVGGYDEALFMYGEDVELSYRLRREGYLLRYCPAAVVLHHSYDDTGRVKPTQYTGSTLGNLYLRLKYGRAGDVMAVPLMAARLLAAPQAYPGSRGDVWRNVRKLVRMAPPAIRGRQASQAAFPFRTWDYDFIRDGAFIAMGDTPKDAPLVSVITRTYRGRELYLRQALLSVAHQTYPAVEHIVVEDGGDTMATVTAGIAAITGRPVHFFGLDKVGRSAAGNRGLAEARGRWCLFLDDDDLLFADHVEVLVQALVQHAGAAAAYALSWEVATDATTLAAGAYTELSHGVPTVHREPFSHAALRHHNLMAIQSVLFERRLFEERGGFDVDMDALEDWTLWNVYAHGRAFVQVPKVTSLYRTPVDPAHAGARMDALTEAYPLAIARAEARVGALTGPARPGRSARP